MTPGLHFFEDADGEWRWHAVSRNGRIVATGAEGYHNRADCEDGAEVASAILLVNLLRQHPHPGAEGVAEFTAQVDAAGTGPTGAK